MEGDRVGKIKGVFNGMCVFLLSYSVGFNGLWSDYSR